MAVASLVLGILGMILSCLVIGVVPSIIGFVLGIVAIKSNKPNKGLAVGGLVTSCVGIAIFIVIVVAMSGSSGDSDGEVSQVVESQIETEIQTGEIVASEELATETETEEETEEETLADRQSDAPFFTYSGNGDDVVTGVATESLSYAHIVHNGDGHFAVKGHRGDRYDLLVNTTKPYDGITLIYSEEEYTFEVNAKGDWTIELYEMGTSSSDSFSGSGDYVTPIFIKTSNVYEVTSSGDGHFAVKGWTNSGYELLVNTTDDNYSGKVLFNRNGEEYAFFEITASRDWEIKPVQ